MHLSVAKLFTFPTKKFFFLLGFINFFIHRFRKRRKKID